MIVRSRLRDGDTLHKTESTRPKQRCFVGGLPWAAAPEDDGKLHPLEESADEM